MTDHPGRQTAEWGFKLWQVSPQQVQTLYPPYHMDAKVLKGSTHLWEQRGHLWISLLVLMLGCHLQLATRTHQETFLTSEYKNKCREIEHLLGKHYRLEMFWLWQLKGSTLKDWLWCILFQIKLFLYSSSISFHRPTKLLLSMLPDLCWLPGTILLLNGS